MKKFITSYCALLVSYSFTCIIGVEMPRNEDGTLVTHTFEWDGGDSGRDGNESGQDRGGRD